MADITIGSYTYKALATVADAEEYITASISENADTWLAGDTTFKARTLVSAQRIIDRQRWLGTPTADPQDNSWPRDGTGVDGVTDGVTPDDILFGLYELTMLLAGDTELANSDNSGSNVKRAKGGDAEVWFFRNTQDNGTPMPTAAWLYIKSYIDGGDGIGAADYGTYSDTAFVSAFDDDAAMLREQGLM